MGGFSLIRETGEDWEIFKLERVGNLELCQYFTRTN